MNDFFVLVRSFLLDFLPNQRCLSDNTIISYKQTLKLFVLYMRTVKNIGITELTFSCIDRDVIVGFIDWLEQSRSCSVNTRNQRLMAFRSFLEYAGIIDCTLSALYLVAKSIPAKKAQGKIVDFLSEEALETFLRQPDITKKKEFRDLVFMALMYDTAARCSEILDMKICDLRLTGKNPIAYLHGKGGKTRTVPLLQRTVEYCEHYLGKYHPEEAMNSKEHLFFTTIQGSKKRMSPDAVAVFFTKYGRRAQASCPGFPTHVHPHMLRHTRAMHLYRSGMPLDLLSQYLGHSQVETTMVYAYADTEMKRASIKKADLLPEKHAEVQALWVNNEEMIMKLAGLI